MNKEDRLRQQIMALRAERDELRRGLGQLQRLVDGILIAATLRYGREHSEDGTPVGRSLTLAAFSVEELLEKYEIHAGKDGTDYVVAVMEK